MLEQILEDENEESPSHDEILALCDLVEEYRATIEATDEELVHLAADLENANHLVESQRKQILASDALVADLEETICVLDDELIDLREVVETVVSLLVVEASGDELLKGLRSVFNIEKEDLVVVPSDSEEGKASADRSYDQTNEIIIYKAAIESQSKMIVDLNERIRCFESDENQWRENSNLTLVKSSGHDVIVLQNLDDKISFSEKLSKENSPGKNFNTVNGTGLFAETTTNSLSSSKNSLGTGRTTIYGSSDSILSVKETNNNLEEAKDSTKSVSGKIRGEVVEVEDSGTSTEEDEEGIEEISIDMTRGRTTGNVKDRRPRNPEAPLSPNSRLKYSVAVLRNKRRNAADKPTETSLSPESGRCVRDTTDDVDIEEINVMGYVTERNEDRKQRKENNSSSKLDSPPQHPVARNKEDQENQWRREREYGESEERASTFVIPLTRIRQESKGGSLVSDTLKRVRNKVNGQGSGQSSSSSLHSHSKSSRDNGIDELYGDDEDHVSRSTRSKKRLALPSRESDDSKHALALEQQNMHKQYLESSSNSPGKDGKNPLIALRTDSPDYGQTPRLIRPLNFSHPVLRSDCDGDFFDRDDLRHSDSRSYSHSNYDVSRTNIADVNKRVSNIISNRGGWDTAKKRTVER